MPLYEYTCTACGASFSLLRPIREMDAPARCRECGGEDTRRVLSQLGAATGGRGAGACAPSG